MSAIDNQPTNKNFLSPLGFKFQIKKSPHLNYFVQAVTLPSLSLGTVEVENPFVKIPFPGDKLNYGQLEVTFKVDEDLQNYLELHDWLVGIGYPENFMQRRDIESAPVITGDGVYSDITLVVLTSSMNSNYEITYKDGYPTNLSELQFDSTLTDVDYLTCTATFAYRAYTIKKL